MASPEKPSSIIETSNNLLVSGQVGVSSEMKRSYGHPSQSAKMTPGAFKSITLQDRAANARYSGSQTGHYSKRSSRQQTNRAYHSLGASKFDTLSSKSVRPSTTFMGVSRKEAIAKHQQVPKNLFNPLTDQMTQIVGGHEVPSSLLQARGDNCFARDVKALNTITAKEKSLLDSLSARTRPVAKSLQAKQAWL